MKKNDICLLGGLMLCLILTLSADAVKTAKAVQNDTLRLHGYSQQRAAGGTGKLKPMYITPYPA